MFKIITCKVGIIEFIDFLNHHGWMFHFDDDPRKIVNWSQVDGTMIDGPSKDQAITINARVQEMKRVDEVFMWQYFMRVQDHD